MAVVIDKAFWDSLRDMRGIPYKFWRN